MAIEEKVRAYGGPQFQVTQQVMNRFAEAIEQDKVDVVPRIAISGGNGAGTRGGGNLMEGLLAMLLSERMGTPINSANVARPETEALRNQIRQGLTASAAQPTVKSNPVTTPLIENGAKTS